MKRVLLITLSIFIIHIAIAQNAKILRGHGIKKLSVFLGTWKSKNADPKDSSFAVYTCRWSVNGNYLVCDQIVTDGAKNSNNLAIYSYDSATDSYKLSLVGIPGAEPFAISMTCKDDTLIYTNEYIANGKKVYTRTLNNFVSNTLYTYKSQSSNDKATWTTLSEGTAIKIAD